MPKKISPTELATHIQKLVEDRQQHAEAIARIDQVLAGVGAALSDTAATAANGKAVAAPAARLARKRRRGRGSFAISAEESILAFVKEHKNPTSAEINAHLKGQGRSAAASNALGKLVKGRKLKRTPIEGERGSRYSLA